MKRIPQELFLVTLILMVALFMRLWGINYDLPYIYHPDEPWPLRIGYNMLVTGDFNPHFFDWPSFIIYFNLFIQVAYYAIRTLLNGGHAYEMTSPLVEIINAPGVTYSPEPAIVLISRLITVAFGLGTIAITIWAGKAISQNFKVGAFAGIIMAISPTNVSLNRFITPDSYATFFITLVLLAVILIFQQGKSRYYMIAGLAIGLGTSSKYNSGLVIITFLAAHFARTGLAGLKDYRLYLALSLGALAFVVTNPYALLDFPTFYIGFLSTSQHYATGHAGMDGNTFNWYLTYMQYTVGIVYLLATVEILRGIYTRSRPIMIVAIFPIVYFTFISSFIVRNDRTFLPLTPFLFLLAASLIDQFLNKAQEIESLTLRKLAISLVITVSSLSLISPTLRTIKDTRQLTTINSRETARIWLADNLPLGSHVMLEAYAPFVEPTRFAVQGIGRMIEHEPTWYIDNGFEYLVFSQGQYGRFYREPTKYAKEISQYNAFFNRFELTKKFTNGNYEIRVYKVK